MFILKTLFDKYCCKPGGRLYACFVDFRKAFETIIHEGLIFKLLQLGIGTNFYNIVTSMYKSSLSCVCLGNGLTNRFKTAVGARQGDVLRPNLFKIYINDLSDYFQSCSDPVKLNTAYLHKLMYADDEVLLFESAAGFTR